MVVEGKQGGLFAATGIGPSRSGSDVVAERVGPGVNGRKDRAVQGRELCCDQIHLHDVLGNCVVHVVENEVGRGTSIAIHVERLEVVVNVRASNQRHILVETQNEFGLGHEANYHKECGDGSHCDFHWPGEEDWHEVLLEVCSHDFLTHGLDLILLPEKAANVSPVVRNTLNVKSQSADEHSHLKHEVHRDGQTGYQTEVLQRWHISQHADEESE